MKKLLKFVLVSSLFLGCGVVYYDSARERQANLEAWKKERIQKEQMEKQRPKKRVLSTMEQWKIQIDRLQKQIIRKSQIPKSILVETEIKWIEELTSLQNQVRKELVRLDNEKHSLQRQIQKRIGYEQGQETWFANFWATVISAGQESEKPTEMTQLEWEVSEGIRQYYTQLQEIQYQIEHLFKLLTIK